jgi:ABC-type Co2+ transport system permease subunit
VQVEGWLIVATVVTWWVGMFIMKYIQIKEERMIDEKTVTAADFSIMFENVPVSYTKADFQKDINKYYD